MTGSKQKLIIAGLEINVFQDSALTDSSNKSVAVLFFLHGRLGSAEIIEPYVWTILNGTREKEGSRRRGLVVVTFDHRNHGRRLVDANANYGWVAKVGTPEDQKNDRHGIDMYSIQTGTASDVSFLIDFLPSYLYPSGEKTITDWIVAGKSLGGHSTWITLKNEKRVKIGVPIIACPDYMLLMSERAKKLSVPFEPPYMPETLKQYVLDNDPCTVPYHASDESNPFLGKKVLVLSGGDDKLVPWSASEKFVEKLEVGKEGKKKVVVLPEVGHECTDEMLHHLVDFLWEELLCAA